MRKLLIYSITAVILTGCGFVGGPGDTAKNGNAPAQKEKARDYKHEGLIYARALTTIQFDDEKSVGFDDLIAENWQFPVYEWKCHITYRNAYNAIRKGIAYVKITYTGDGNGAYEPKNWKVLDSWIYK